MLEKSLKPRVYTVATSHLDTSWNWDFETTIREYIPKTLRENFALFEKYPEYVFSFEGSYRYELMEEYYPEDFEKLKEYVAAGRWNVTGSAYENGDVNIPSPEALFRNILLGNGYFDKTFGKRSVDIFLPDCFGFGYALPSVMRHANLLGFTTQKLCWSSAYHIPFDLGIWRGVDGAEVFASFDAMNYTTILLSVRGKHGPMGKLHGNMRQYGLPFTYIFHGVGDRGGAPKEISVKTVCEEARKNASSRVDVLSAPADRVFRDMEAELTQEQKKRLPVWDKELVSTDHGVGGYTSRTVGTRWNRKGEQLAAAAERASVGALLTAGAAYPQNTLNVAWKRLVAHQFHDDITGTSLMRCYQRNWNDYILSLNQFAEEYRASAAATAARLDTSFAKGTAVVVSNPVQCAGLRTETVTAEVLLDEKFPAVAVFDANGKAVPAGIVNREGRTARVAFSAAVPSVGYAAFDVQGAKSAASESALRVSKNSLENERYLVKIDANGDIESVFDKEIERELLGGPIRFAVFSYDGNIMYPAWELNYEEVAAAPKAYAKNPLVEITEDSPARVELKITKTAGKSTFVQWVSLDAGGAFVRVQNEVDWRSLRSLLKVEFPLKPENPTARYDLGLGSIERLTNTKRLFEVPAQMWADISDRNNTWGVSVFSDARTGWDKPDNHTLRMTVVHTPKHCFREESGQHLMDLGLNRFGFALMGHRGKAGRETVLEAENFNQPMHAFVTEAHKGDLGKQYSLCNVSDNGVVLRAMKKAEDSDEIVVRFNETEKKDVKGVRFTLDGGIESAREIFASEEHLCPAQVEDGALVFDIAPFGVKSFALKVKKYSQETNKGLTALNLPFNVSVTSANGNYGPGVLPGGLSIPAELYPERVVCGKMEFVFGKESLNALQCKGQKLALSGKAKRVILLAAAVNGDREVVFQAGKTRMPVRVADMFERVGVWDMVAFGESAHIKRDVLAWNATHMHDKDGDVFAKQAYIFKYALNLPKGCKEVTLPQDENLYIFAALEEASSMAFEPADALYDKAERREMDYWITDVDLARAKPSLREHKQSYLKFGKNYLINRTLREIAVWKRVKHEE